ncbi:hypothetical protein AB0D10_01305 [Kitasatospora sp. NPDC048545]|uniref:hypothetical protein n=1 Tax=Kitasatospora sp. NPDC048545 TaxID=3157208 RepID=UPI003411C137
MITAPQAPNTHIALDAAAPVAKTMADLPPGARGAIRFSYMGESVNAHYLKGLHTDEQFNAAMPAAITAFGEAGWGYRNHFWGDGETIRSTRFTHPASLGWIGRPGTGPHTLSSALAEAAAALGEPGAAERLAPHMTLREVEAITLLLATSGHIASGATWARVGLSR